MTLGDIIKDYRKTHNMSMGEFAEKSNISKAYISLLEKNRHPKSGNPIAPSIQCIKQAAEGMGMDFNVLFAKIDGNVSLIDEKASDIPMQPKSPHKKGTPINVFGRVAAGIPIEAIEDIIDTEEITEELAATGDFFGLQIKGDSMEPRITEGDQRRLKQYLRFRFGLSRSCCAGATIFTISRSSSSITITEKRRFSAILLFRRRCAAATNKPRSTE